VGYEYNLAAPLQGQPRPFACEGATYFRWSVARSREELVAKMAEKLEGRVPEAVFSFSQPIELRVSELISGVRSDMRYARTPYSPRLASSSANIANPANRSSRNRCCASDAAARSSSVCTWYIT
jgi:hypothetical protein